MCQSKAEGGRRCNFHLVQGVTSGMTAYTASVTGLPTAQTKAAFHTLEREGLTAPDPTREEVDEFLEQQAFRVRHEPTLSEPRRESIVKRLLAAIGRVTPNGATFHAWKNLVAESWTRVRRKAAAAFLVGALSFSIGACGNAPSTADDPHDTAAPVGAPVTPGQQYDTAFHIVKPALSDEAVAAFGKDGAAAGTDAALAFSQKAFYDDECVSTKAGENADECAYSLGEYMTAQTQADWNKNVQAFIADSKANDFGSSEGSQAVLAVSFYGAMAGKPETHGGHVFAPIPSGPVMVNKKISKVTTGVTDDGRLSVTVKSSADMRLLHDHKPSLWHVNRSVTYYMVKSGGTWKIDGYYGKWASTGISPDNAA